MLSHIRRGARRILPARVHRLLRAYASSDLRAASRVVRTLRTTGGHVVRSGPFEGMQYLPDAVGSELAPKLVGTYEKEVARVIAPASSAGHDVFIDIGAAEGYFAVGLVWRSKQARCLAFEVEADGQRLIRRLAERNGVAHRVKICGLCTLSELRKQLAGCDAPFVLCDCEGGELELLDPEAAPELRKATILVEVHGRMEVPPGKYPDHPTAMAALLTDRFRLSHSVQVIPLQKRLASDWPSTLSEIADDSDRLAAMNEHRSPGPGWLWLKPV